MSSVTKLPLCDGHDIPQICLASFRLPSTDQTKERVKLFYAAGGRHFELAEVFGNAHTVCEALRELKADRNELYITLKAWPKGRKLDVVISSCTALLQEIGLDYVDLLMIHAPIDMENKSDQWKALEDLRDLDVAKSLGAVNLSAVGLTDLLKNCRITPCVLEMEVTPFHQKADLTEFCNDSSMVVLDNEPLSKGIRSQHPPLVQLADQLSLPADIVLLRYAAAKGFVVGLPASFSLDLLRGDAEGSLLQPLPAWVVCMLDGFEEALQLAWVPPEPTPLEVEELLG